MTDSARQTQGEPKDEQGQHMTEERQPASPEMLALVRSHFNEPVLMYTLEVGRCIGYSEDDCDCYIIISFPGAMGRSGRRGKPHIVHCSMVGGYYFLDALRNESRVIGHTGEEWNNLVRLDGDLNQAGVPRRLDFTVSLHGEQEPSDLG